jgi:uncharacterized membrane protein YphA (DoxX/SURF4 family)
MIERKIGSISRVLLGLVFLAAGVAKVADLGFFTYELMKLPLGLPNPVLFALAQAFTVVEITLGVGLLLNLVPRFSLPLSLALLFMFVGIALWAQFGHLTNSCGCFGSILRRSPVETLIEDTVFIMLGMLAWGFTVKGAPVTRLRVAILGVGFLAALSLPYVIPKWKPGPLVKPLSFSELTIQGTDLQLGKGEYLLAVMDAKCASCRTALPRLNEISARTDVPRLVAVTPSTRGGFDSFRAGQRVDFPVTNVAPGEFRSLNVKKSSLLWLKDGTVKRAWPMDSLPSTPELIRMVKE